MRRRVPLLTRPPTSPSSPAPLGDAVCLRATRWVTRASSPRRNLPPNQARKSRAPLSGSRHDGTATAGPCPHRYVSRSRTSRPRRVCSQIRGTTVIAVEHRLADEGAALAVGRTPAAPFRSAARGGEVITTTPVARSMAVDRCSARHYRSAGRARSHSWCGRVGRARSRPLRPPASPGEGATSVDRDDATALHRGRRAKPARPRSTGNAHGLVLCWLPGNGPPGVPRGPFRAPRWRSDWCGALPGCASPSVIATRCARQCGLVDGSE